MSEEKTMTLDERVDAFNNELKAILGKYELALFAQPEIYKGAVVARVKVQDAKLLAEEIEKDKAQGDEPVVLKPE